MLKIHSENKLNKKYSLCLMPVILTKITKNDEEVTCRRCKKILQKEE